ncbi:MAG: hypothetical protein LW816_19600 [Planctomyces sp.]|nr:hypothetical protein [Planctomyces sp.]
MTDKQLQGPAEMTAKILTTLIVLCFVFVTVRGCTRPAAPEWEVQFDKLQLGMTEQQVVAIMGPGKRMTTEQLNQYDFFPKQDPANLPDDVIWIRWGELVPYVAVAISDGGVVIKETGPVNPTPL